MKVIAFCGRARVGKSFITRTLADHLFDNGYIPIILPLAAPLKAAAEEAGFGKTTDPTGYRLFCQEHGAAKREENENYWLERWHDMLLDAMMRELGSKHEYVVIVDDVRYTNELQFINNMENSRSIFVDEGSRSGTLEDDTADWRMHHSEYLANSAHDDWNMWKELFDFRFNNCGEAWDDLKLYITTGEGLGKVTEAWLGNFLCDCELCRCYISNGDVDEDRLIASLNNLLNEDELEEMREAEKEDDDESDDTDA